MPGNKKSQKAPEKKMNASRTRSVCGEDACEGHCSYEWPSDARLTPYLCPLDGHRVKWVGALNAQPTPGIDTGLFKTMMDRDVEHERNDVRLQMARLDAEAQALAKPRFDVVVAADGRIKLPTGTVAANKIRPGDVLTLVIREHAPKAPLDVEFMEQAAESIPGIEKMLDDFMSEAPLKDQMAKLKIPPEKARKYAKRMMLSMLMGIAQGIRSVDDNIEKDAPPAGGLNNDGLED